MTNKGHSRHETLGSEQTVTPRQSHVRPFRCCWPGGLSSPASGFPSGVRSQVLCLRALNHALCSSHRSRVCYTTPTLCPETDFRGGKKKKTTTYSHNFQPVSKTRVLHPNISPFPEAFYFPNLLALRGEKKNVFLALHEKACCFLLCPAP